MFANRYTAFIDACSLTGALKRDLLLTLAKAEFFRVRWSAPVLDEMERAVAGILAARSDRASTAKAAATRATMERMFSDAMVTDFERLRCVVLDLPDPKDIHVVAAALQTRADVIVTDNVRHFPESILAPLGMEVRTTDDFLANTIELAPVKAASAIDAMRRLYKRPELDQSAFLVTLEARELIEVANALKPFFA